MRPTARQTAFYELSHELDTKIFHIHPARLLGQVNGGGFAPVVYEVPEMRV